MTCGCTKKKPAGKPKSIGFGEAGLLKLIQVVDPPYDVYGEFTDAFYPFTERTTRYVDVRDAIYLLGKDFELVQ